MDLSERLKVAMAGPPEVKPVDLARACGVRAPSVADWLNGRTKRLEGANLLAAAEFLRVNPWWLATGKGKIHAPYHLVPREDLQASIEIAPAPTSTLPKEKLHAMELLRAVPDERMTYVIETLTTVLAASTTTGKRASKAPKKPLGKIHKHG
ncbi:hypothetical protein [Cupriavidus nantongensis]|uniref:hypothetical protein n=1 Tax=Cupriavidus nantongensis TaxID=1796606 RepID=UPI001E476848|nr:hypothetical protein [Cupriavidus nantongensis]